MKFKKPLIIAAIVLVVLGIIFSGDKEAIEIEAKAAEQGSVESTVSNTRAGTVKACRRSRLSMPIGGTVDKLLVKEGDHVEQGQVLLELWNKNHLAQFEQTKAALAVAENSRAEACANAELARRSEQRVTTLEKRKLTSIDLADRSKTAALAGESICEMAKHQVDAAKANMDLQAAILELTVLRAPFAGVIAEINGEVGEYVTPSPQGIMTPPAVDIIDDTCLYITAPIDEVDAMPVQTGMEARITLDAFRGKTFAGTLTRIAPYVQELEKQARTVDVDVQPTNVPADIRLLIGYSADIEVILQRRDNVLRIPTEAVQDENHVFIYNPSEASVEKREFKAGISNWTWTEVLAGIKPGEMVVTTPDKPGLSDEGAKVRVHE